MRSGDPALLRKRDTEAMVGHAQLLAPLAGMTVRTF